MTSASASNELWQDAIEEGTDPLFSSDPFSSDQRPVSKQATSNIPPAKVQVVESGVPTSTATDNPRPSRKFGIADAWRNRDMSLSNSIRSHRKLLAALAFVCVVVSMGVLIASLKKVPSTEMGVQYNIHKKQLEDATKSGGLFIGPPGFKFIKFPSTFITADFRDRTCVSNDGLHIKFSVMFQYQMTASNVYPTIIKYRNFEKWASIVEQAGLSSIHHSCAEFMVTEFQNKRGVIQSSMLDNLKLKLEGNENSGEDGVNAVAVSLQLTYVHLPEQYNKAVAEKQAAEEDIALAIAQRKQETTKANTELLKAKEESRKIEDTAKNEAEVLLTETKLRTIAEKLVAFPAISLRRILAHQYLSHILIGFSAAKEDIALAKAQRQQETTKANTELLKANEEVTKIEDTANHEAEVLLTEAKLKAEETIYSFQKEAEALLEVKNKLNLTTEGVLAYLSNRLLSEASNLRVTTGEPAKLSRKDEL
eukprot:CAMPEP_0196163864 /NCGR_PEP_ID=MMETSP0911-20130528/193_1 /TAXON_ID=49265 /ORGANISM="Thalassiosira rotula, Strain GSO102" /LENGTH=478 /DNA_ID=CAMNT_0041428899 /DNA_START=95 /DNA_END=1533 /DNA_ORIENTATION=-